MRIFFDGGLTEVLLENGMRSTQLYFIVSMLLQKIFLYWYGTV